MQVSVIIVNYNAGEYILLTLESVFRAVKNYRAEVIVVDNASSDGSLAEVRRNFPQTIVIANSANTGFAAANNIGMRRAQGEFVLLLNPDTIIGENTFDLLLGFMKRIKDAGIIGCRILNADGSFSVDSRHSVPSPLTALWKLLGLNRLFPRSKTFARYNLTYLDPDQSDKVDAVSGSFMFLRRQACAAVGLLDERFFMYGEDLDYCYRMDQKGWKVYYYPAAVIVHYKGQSTRKNSFGYSWNFNRSLFLFYKKHFHYHFAFIMHGIILLGLGLRGTLVYLLQNIKTIIKSIRRDSAGSEIREKKIIWAGSVMDFEKQQEILKSFSCQVTAIIAANPTAGNLPGLPVIGNLQNTDAIVIPSGVRDFVFDADNLTFNTIIDIMSRLSKLKLRYKILLSRIPVLIGKE